MKNTIKELNEILTKGCSACDVDEAEGGLVDHCDVCCRMVTARVYDLLILQRRVIRKRQSKFSRLVFFGGAYCEYCRGVWDYFGNEWR